MKERWADRFGPYGFDTELVRIDLGSGASQEDIGAALSVVDASLRPAPKPTILNALARLRALTKAREGENDEMAAIAYAEELSAYPADVVAEACKSMARDCKFFPAWSELRDACEWRVRKRKRLKEAFERELRRNQEAA